MMKQTVELSDGAAQFSSSAVVSELGLGGDYPLRVAVASSNGKRVDRHFGQTDDLWIFDVAEAEQKMIEVRNIGTNALGDEDRRQTIYRLVADCKVLLIAKIGVTPREKLASLGVEGIDKHSHASVDAALRDVYRIKTSQP